MVAIQLEKGHTHLDLELADEKLIEVVTGQDIPPLPRGRIEEIIFRSISNHAPDHVAEKKICIIIPDDTRLWARGDLYVPCIVKALNSAGVPFAQIKVMVALGTHAPMEKDRMEDLAGAYTCENVETLNSANRDFTRLVSMGKTPQGTELAFTREACEADHIIIYGGVLHHLIAGYGGGRKYILPGIAGYETIQQNHSLAFGADGSARPEVRQACAEGNPVHQDMVDAARIFLKDKTCSHVALAANGAGEIFHCEVGDLFPTFERGCQQLNQACCVTLAEKGDFALISAGGHRTDGQLYQATKALFNAVNLVKDGGSILFTAACAQGVGNPDFGRALTKYKDNAPALGKALASGFKMPDYVAFRVLDILDRFQVTLASDMDPEQIQSLGFKTTEDPQTFVNQLTGRGYVVPFAENILPLLTNAD